MLNIIPPQQKEILKKEYSRRKSIVWLAAVSVALTISLVMLSSAYFISKVRANEAAAELERSKQVLDTELQPKEVTSQLSAAVHNTEALKPYKNPRSVYTLMRIFETKSSAIKITNLSFSDGGGKAIISVTGKAADRESLTTFGHELEAHPEFASVEIPVSNFVKESDIDFSMSVTVK